MDYYIHFDDSRHECYVCPLYGVSISYSIYENSEVHGILDNRRARKLYGTDIENLDYDDLIKILGEER